MKLPKKFGAYLKQLRKEKGLTIRDLTKKTGVSNAYISQMETGKRGIPTPEILRKIHEPLGVGYDELMVKAGYITPETRSELLPETIQAMDSYEVINELFSNAADIFAKSVRNQNGSFNEYLKKYVLDQSNDLTEEEFEYLNHDSEITNKIINHLTLEEKVKFLNLIVKDYVSRNIDPREIFKSDKEKISENKVSTLRVPILGHIAAGQPIFAEEHIEDWVDIPNMWNLKDGEAIVLKVKGDSMIGSRIYDGDKVIVKIQQDVESGEIAVVNINGDEATLKRVKKTETGQVILYPDNPNYDPIFIQNEKARIIGKVIQVMFEP
jgi:SOS regulatory protein LexA